MPLKRYNYVYVVPDNMHKVRKAQLSSELAFFSKHGDQSLKKIK